MSIPSIIRGGETVTIKRTPEINLGNDEYGNPIQPTTTTIKIKNVLVAFGTTAEPLEVGRNPEDIQLTLYMPKKTVIEDGDIFIIRGIEFIKNGIASEWLSPGNLHSVIVPVRRRHG